MITTWPQFYTFLLAREGRVVHHDPLDPGGMTAWGISRRYNPKWEGWKLVDAGITSGPEFEALVHDFYWKWLKPFWEGMGPRLREAFCDAMVNMGPGRKGDKIMGAVELLQHAVNRLAGTNFVDVDARYGPQTRAALRSVDSSALAYTLCALRCAEYARRDGAKHYLSGWVSRVGLLMDAI